jgi:dihydrofolate synthase/folylpolyglutamate synthase
VAWTIERALAALEEHVNLESLVSGVHDPPTLDRMARLCALMGDPQRAYPVLHVTGTNGKGSTTRMATALLQAAGLSVGTYTSPHLERVHERISWNGEPIGDLALAEAVGAIVELEAATGVRPSWFELVTATAFRWFADIAVEAAVLEVGLLGRWDATNVADASVAVVTNVGLDHTDYAGPTRLDIAREKGGIVKPGSVLVLGETDPSLRGALTAGGPAEVWSRDADFGCDANRVAVGGRLLDLRTPGASYRDVFVPLHGAHQGDNAAAAVAAVEAFFGRPLDEEVVAEALGSVQVPGRFEVVGRHPLVVLDGAHNPDGARAAAETMAADFSSAGGVVLVVGMNRGREPAEVLAALGAGSARLVVTCAADWPKAVPAAELAEAARALGAEAESAPSVAEAIRRAIAVASPEDAVLITGSLYVVGDARPLFAKRPGPPRS